MNHTIQLTTAQFQALQSGQSITIEPPKPAITKWEPAGGRYIIYFGEDTAKAGIEYQTQAQASSAAKQLRSYARQLAWVSEHYDSWVADWSDNKQCKYYVYYSNGSKTYEVSHGTTAQLIGLIYMSHSNATKLAQLMNDGIVEF